MSPSSRFVSPLTWSQVAPDAQDSTSAATARDMFTGELIAASNCSAIISAISGSRSASAFPSAGLGS